MAYNFVLLGASRIQKISQVKLPHSDGDYSRLCFSVNSKKLYALDPSQGAIHTWDLMSTKHQNQISINQPVQWNQLIAIDENIILMADSKGDVWNFNLKKKTLTQLYKQPMDDRDGMFMIFDQKSSQLILIRSDGSIKYLGYRGEQITNISRIDLKNGIERVAFSKDYANFATVDWSNNVNFRLANESKPIWTKNYKNGKICSLCFGLTKDLLVLSEIDGSCWGINTKLAQVNWKISCRPRLFNTNVSQDGNYIYVLVGSIRKIRSKTGTAAFHIHRIPDGQLVFQQKLKGDMPKALEVSPDGKFVAALSEGKIFLWEVESNLSEK
ncbi:WD40 repeat domain-containing protein [Gimesia alba]|nr:WD40 repeat domain-containing protein [Gimesia alba]